MNVTGIGQCSYDHLAVVDSFPDVDTKKEVLLLEDQGGGPVATALVTLSRLGLRCRFHGITGDDGEGEKIRQSLDDENIDVAGLLKRPGASSQIAFIVIEQQTGKRTIFWKRPSGAALRPDELDERFLDNTAFLLLDGLMKDVSLYAAREAKKRNIPVMLDAGRVREGMLDIARHCDYVVASEEFAKELGWKDDPEAFREALQGLKLGRTTITLGARGSITFADNKIIKVPAFAVDTVDTTGAGDVFHGGYIFGLLQKWNLLDTVRFASAVAAMKCTKLGGRTGIPKINEVRSFLNERGTALPGER